MASACRAFATYTQYSGDFSWPNWPILGKAVEGLAPNAEAKAEAKKGNKQAADDLKETSS